MSEQHPVPPAQPPKTPGNRTALLTLAGVLIGFTLPMLACLGVFLCFLVGLPEDWCVCGCAGCQRVRTRDGGWLPVQQFLPLAPRVPFEVTHGMCDACYHSLDVDADAGSAADAGASG